LFKTCVAMKFVDDDDDDDDKAVLQCGQRTQNDVRMGWWHCLIN